MSRTHLYIILLVIGLCTRLAAAECQDDPSLDCPRLSTLINICDDVDNAIVTCPNYCNLCPIDGGWSDWSDWSSCNVTCEDGVQSRVRSCDNPLPENRGRNCDGEDVEYLPCSNNPCPVHGSWSVWSEWGTCSVSCDVGIQRRDRHCSSPYPDNNGDHCFGDSRDDRICMTSPCADGGWSSWGTWDECSVSCGGGLTKRHRYCNNPTPSTFGRQCEGNNVDTDVCNGTPCNVGLGIINSSAIIDGSWSSWGTWDECSVSCGGGLKKRHRHCNNPTPSLFGRQCEGNNVDTDVCNGTPCNVDLGISDSSAKTGDEIAFKADFGYKTSSTGDRMIFPNDHLNLGHGYTNSTGIFTAPVSGLYSFSATIRNPTMSSFYFDIRNNGHSISGAYLHSDQQYASSSITTITELDTGDEVYVYVSYSGSISEEYYNQFTGHLVHRFTY